MAEALVSDAGRMRLLHLDDLASPSPQWLGSPGGGDEEFDAPFGLAATGNGGFVVADSGNHRIVACDDVGLGGWSALGSRGSGAHEFEQPSGVALDALGRIYVADTGNGRIVRIDAIDGYGWTTYGSPGVPTAADPQAVGHFRVPLAVAVDQNGRIWVADQDLSRIVRIDDMSGAGWIATPAGVPAGVASAPKDGMLVAELGGRRVTLRDDDTLVPLAGTADGTLAGPATACPSGSEVVALDAASARLVMLDDQLVPAGTAVYLRDLGARRPIGMCVL